VSTNKGRTTKEISKTKDKKGNLSYEKVPEFPKYKIKKKFLNLFIFKSGWRRSLIHIEAKSDRPKDLQYSKKYSIKWTF